MPVPHDSVLLPLSDGALLVSRSHAVFCRLPNGELDAARAVVADSAPLDALSAPSRRALEQHGFFGPPRPPKPDPPTVQLQLTNACNLACAYCCTNSGRPRSQEVGFDQMLGVVRQIPEAFGPGTGVALLGGEPLAVPWAISLASEILRLGLGLTIFTNGVLLANDDLAQQVAALVNAGALAGAGAMAGAGAQVRVSLAGPTAESCDGLSGASRFDAALQGLHRLAAHGGRATVDLMFTPQSIEATVRELPRLGERLPPHTPIALGVLYRGGRETGAHLFESRAELEAALDRVAFDGGVAVEAPATGPLTHRREACPCASGRHLHVRSDGALFTCFKMEEQVGHLSHGDFAATARAALAHPHRASDGPPCAGCALATLCGGGCRSDNVLYTGNPNEPPCGQWRVRVVSELLAEDQVTAVEWPAAFLLQEARRRGIETPSDLRPRHPSRHLLDV